jgi:tRNA threonylcarbamoyladenosine biosynthesis protein TsaB
MSAPDPPLLLAIEAATALTSAALVRGEALIDEEVADPDAPAAACLLPAVDTLLSRNRIGLEEVEGFALSVGPGSFTGLRIGVATVKGLAFGLELPVLAVPTLEALAYGAGSGEEAVVATLDARRGELYAAGYGPGEGVPSQIVAEGLYAPLELLALLPPRCRIVGEAAAVAGSVLRERLRPTQLLEDEPSRAPRARDVGMLGARRLARGQATRAADLVPRYVRRAEAEARRLGDPIEGPAGAL